MSFKTKAPTVTDLLNATVECRDDDHATVRFNYQAGIFILRKLNRLMTFCRNKHDIKIIVNRESGHLVHRGTIEVSGEWYWVRFFLEEIEKLEAY